MRQVVQDRRSGAIEVRDVPAPVCQASFIVVENAASLISTGTERSMVELGRRSLLGKALERPDLVRKVLQVARERGLREAVRAVAARLDEPGPLGYSSAGTVVEVGAGVSGLAPGDRVACAGTGYAVHAELVAVPASLTVPVPPGVSLEAAAFVALGAVALHGVRTAEVSVGDAVVVIGLGLVGQLTVQILKAAGCKVIGLDLRASRCLLAARLGADVARVPDASVVEVVLAETAHRGADAVIVTAATKSSAPLQLAGVLARDRARVSVVGDVGMQVPRQVYYAKELELRISRSYGPGRYDPRYEQDGVEYPPGYVPWTERRNMAEFVRLLATGSVKVEELISARFEVDRAREAYAALTRPAAPDVIAALFTYPRAVRRETRVPLTRGEWQRTRGRPVVGFVGAGTFARSVLLPRFRAHGAQLRTVVTATPVTAETVARRFGFALAASDPVAVLEDPEVEVAVIATRHDSHARFAAQALRADKHVFLEKPMALTSAELDEVRRAAASSRGLLMVGYNRRFAPLAARLKDAIGSWSRPLAVVYRVNAGAIAPDHWTRDLRAGGGRIIGEACHFVDFIQFVAGSHPVEVMAYAVQPGDGGTVDTVSIQLRLANGSLGVVHYFALGDRALAKERVEVFAPGAAAVLDDFRCLEIFGAGRRVSRCRLRRQDKGHDAEVATFLEAVQGRRHPPIPLGDLVLTSAATFAALESLQTGKPAPVRITPDQ